MKLAQGLGFLDLTGWPLTSHAEGLTQTSE